MNKKENLEKKLAKNPEWKLEYCDNCQEIMKHNYVSFKFNDKIVEYYICDRCGKIYSGWEK